MSDYCSDSGSIDIIEPKIGALEEVNSDTTPKRPCRGPTPTHPIWNYFETDYGKKRSTCQSMKNGRPCKKELSGNKVGNYEYHLKSNHPDVSKNYLDEKRVCDQQRKTSISTKSTSSQEQT